METIIRTYTCGNNYTIKGERDQPPLKGTLTGPFQALLHLLLLINRWGGVGRQREELATAEQFHDGDSADLQNHIIFSCFDYQDYMPFQSIFINAFQNDIENSQLWQQTAAALLSNKFVQVIFSPLTLFLDAQFKHIFVYVATDLFFCINCIFLVKPLLGRKNELDKQRKEIKELWQREQKKMVGIFACCTSCVMIRNSKLHAELAQRA